MRIPLSTWRAALLAPVALSAGFLCPPSTRAQAPDYTSIQTALGAPGVLEPDGVLHFDLVRADLAITVGTQAVDSAEVGNGYVNFKPLSNSMWYVNGSLPTQETESSAVEATLRLKQSIKITTVGNQVALESPRLLWVHFEAQDLAPALAAQVNLALGKMGSPQKNVTSVPVAISVIPGALFSDAFLGANGTIALLNGKVFVFTVPRDDIDNYRFGNVPASASTGVAYNFYVQPLPTANNIILHTDLALKPAELQPVRDALAASGLNVSGVHDNFIDNNIRLLNMNGFVIGDAGTLGDSLYNSLTTILNNVD